MASTNIAGADLSWAIVIAGAYNQGKETQVPLPSGNLQQTKILKQDAV